MENLKEYLQEADTVSYKPEFFRLSNYTDKEAFSELLRQNNLFVYDEIDSQMRELIKCLNPHLRIKDEEYPHLVARHLNGCDANNYGVWIYYPWSRKLVHSLDEEEFVEVRTNRNKYKLTTEEQKYLAGKKIGIIGLSVGQSIALTIAMERICGELRLTDFDTAELSNLNRIRTGLHNLGLKKTVIAAREIAEIDPFINVKIYSEGLQKDNIDTFFSGDGKLDLLVEVCDGLDIKILSRFKAKELGIPVVMDTNDRGMMDIERFDLEPERPVLHGLAGDLNPDNIKDLTNEQKIPYIFKMVGIDTLSTRLKASMLEVSQSINTWPQLASSVVLGGALTTDVARRILLDQYHDSGRYYVDPEQLIANKSNEDTASYATVYDITITEMQQVAEKYFKYRLPENNYVLPDDAVDNIIIAASEAYSCQNIHNCSYYFDKGILFVFVPPFVSRWDTEEIGKYISLGAVLENIHVQAKLLMLQDVVELSSLEDEKRLAATIAFTPLEKVDEGLLKRYEKLGKDIEDKNFIKKRELPLDFLNNLQYLVSSGEEINILYTDKPKDIAILANVAGASQRLQLLDIDGHCDFYRDISWNGESLAGDVRTLGYTDAEIGGYSVAKDWKVANYLKKWDKGNAFKMMAAHKASQATGMLLITIPNSTKLSYIAVGKLIESIYVYFKMHNRSVSLFMAPSILSHKLTRKDKNINEQEVTEIIHSLYNVFNINKEYENGTQVFLMKLALPAA